MICDENEMVCDALSFPSSARSIGIDEYKQTLPEQDEELASSSSRSVMESNNHDLTELGAHCMYFI